MKYLRQRSFLSSGSSFLLIVFLLSLFNPTISWALSTGPGQPELQGFSPISLDNMVNLSTGDFSYNLPVMTVPGPGGGYPINLSYSAQPGMEQVSSWVGLGWSLNPGVVNREVRGLPDDFAGQDVKKIKSTKPNRTIAINISAKEIEALGLELNKIKWPNDAKLGGNINLSYNNYRGFSIQGGLGFSEVESNESKGSGTPLLTAKIDESGESVLTLSFLDKILNAESRKQFYKSITSENIDYGKFYTKTGLNLAANSAFGFSTARSTRNLSFDHPFSNFSSTMNIKGGLTIFSVTADIEFDVFYSRQEIKRKIVSLPSFGYLFHDLNYLRSEGGLTDFTRENQAILSPEISTIPIPNFTYDVFHVSGQGLSGKVRAYRNEVAKLSEPESVSKSGDLGFGAELNGNINEVKVGVNPRGSYSITLSGDWSDQASSIRSYYSRAKSIEEDVPGSESTYFKFAGELTATTNESGIHADHSLGRFKLSTAFSGTNSVPVLNNSLTSRGVKSLNSTYGFRNSRVRRAKLFHTFSELEANDYYPWNRQVYNLGNSQWENVDRNTNELLPESSLIGEVRVTTQNGSQYIYGIPAKNKIQRQTTFSKSKSDAVEGALSDIPKVISYDATDNSIHNDEGDEELYSSTETPEHAHSFLLTEIISEDYVDVSEDGPSPDDLGSYTAFEYSVVKNFKSKSPISGANYAAGDFSNTADDKASFTFFKKDIYYLKHVKTKTHIAVFKLDATGRSDKFGVSGENDNAVSGKDSYRLERIDLYNLEEYEASPSTAVPIKTVHFTMDYSLCKNQGQGKLTLKKVWFSAGDELTKASLSPYEFSYGANGSRFNPNYNNQAVDRWGSYQRNGDNSFESNVVYPYVQQENRALADSNAAAWSLQEIKLPTGGKIKVSYEADDYAWVQDKSAMQMYRIKGFANSATGSTVKELDDSNIWMVVELPNSIATDDFSKAKAYFNGITETYFKAFVKLKKFPTAADKPDASSLFNNSNVAWDYVNGYLKLNPSTAVPYGGSGGTTNQVVVKVEKIGGTHPIKKAAWINLNLNRNDLISEYSFSFDGLNNLTQGTLKSITGLLENMLKSAQDEAFFLKADALGWGDKIETSPVLPASIVRLNSIGTKIGGGHRVSKLEISDEWAAMGGAESYTYGQEYIYNDPNGNSYGVAQYEPIVGGEENPFRLPELYGNGDFNIARLFQDDYLSVEQPLGEAFYPSATVVYEKVQVRNLANQIVTTSGAGIQVHEFYTAKDYPVLTEKSDLQKVNTENAKKIFSFVGGKNYFEPGFSQGFKVELNDMHGKSKRTATYAAGADIEREAPSQEKLYYYHSKNGYNAQKRNVLDNQVRVFYGDGYSEYDEIGVEQDTYFDLKETRTQSIAGSINPNLSTVVIIIPIPLPSAVPNIDYNYSATRWVSMTKVVERTGVLEKVVTRRDGAEVTEEYLGFDFDTGQPVIASSTTPFNDKTYTYNQLAKWHYQDLGGKYQNIGLSFKGAQLDDFQQFLHSGDVLMDHEGSKVWVVIDGANVNFYDKNGNAQTLTNGDTYTLVDSGYSNRLAEAVGAIQTIGNPIDQLNENFALFKSYNQSSISNRNTVHVKNCEDNTLVTLPVSTSIMDADGQCPLGGNCFNDSIIKISFEQFNNAVFLGSCTPDVMEVIFPYDGVLTNPYVLDLYFLWGDKVLGVEPGGKKHYGIIREDGIPWTGSQGIGECFDFCLEGILNSSFTAYSDTLRTFEDYNGTTTGIANNPYYWNARGIFQASKSMFFPTARSQASSGGYDFATNIAADGEYERFGRIGPELENQNWKEANNIQKIDHNGMVVEQNNALNIPSSALYGYNRTLSIAAAQNAVYSEIAFDGFEEHADTTYESDKKDNHINFGANVSIVSDGHTGSFGLKLNAASVSSSTPSLQNGKSYVVMAWHKVGTPGGLKAYQDGAYIEAEVISPNIEGWELLQLRFTADTSADVIQLYGLNGVFDDVRVQPFNSSMVCYVYDRRTYQLLAQLDENHFATFYNYDKDLTLVQVKKETARGIKTLQSTQRSQAQIN